MKILHINDLAGVAGILCKYLRKAGHQADLISFMDDHEFGFCKFYGGKHFEDQQIMMHVLEGVIPQYDIIHLHFSHTFLPWLYKFNKPIVFHAHGTEIATQTMGIRIAAQKAEGILVSGEQLVQYHPRAKYLPNPVDTEHFYSMPEHRGGFPHLNPDGSIACIDLLMDNIYRYFIFDIPYLDTERARREAGVDAMVINRATNTIPYSELPKFINQFEGYIDYRYHKERGLLTDLSKTALEALACGLRVYHDGQWKEGLPEQHKPENVVSSLVSIYAGILQ